MTEVTYRSNQLWKKTYPVPDATAADWLEQNHVMKILCLKPNAMKYEMSMHKSANLCLVLNVNL